MFHFCLLGISFVYLLLASRYLQNLLPCNFSILSIYLSIYLSIIYLSQSLLFFSSLVWVEFCQNLHNILDKVTFGIIICPCNYFQLQSVLFSFLYSDTFHFWRSIAFTANLSRNQSSHIPLCLTHVQPPPLSALSTGMIDQLHLMNLHGLIVITQRLQFTLKFTVLYTPQG